MDFSKLRVIVVEDSSFARAVNYTQLKKLGFTQIDMPDDSAEALEMITQSLVGGEPYDLVITDINMPVLDGFELIDKLKSDPISHNQKIMVISADADEFIKSAALDSGASAYLVKPVEIEALKTTLQKILS